MVQGRLVFFGYLPSYLPGHRGTIMHIHCGQEELFSIYREVLFISQTQSEGRGNSYE
jgi:hypothetical protein